MLTPSRSHLRWGLTAAGLSVVAYSLVVVVIVAITPDLRLRWLLVDSTAERGRDVAASGLLIRQADGVLAWGEAPRAGDFLTKLDGVPVVASVDAAWRLIRGFPAAEGASEQTLTDSRTVSVEFWRPQDQKTFRSELVVQSVPDGELGLTLVWLLCQFGILGVGAWAFWKRPFDRPVRLFFAMCVVTLGAFVGGFHWWLLSGSLLLTLPFVVCAVLLPSVTLHFFLVYPQPKSIIAHWHTATLWALYGPPLAASASFVVVELLVWNQLWNGADSPLAAAAVVDWLHWLRLGVYGYVTFAAIYFAATLACLLHSVWTTQPLLQRQQVTSILWAALIASLFISYTLVLTWWDRVAFALGGARLPMFLSSLVFMVAYAVSIVRFKLMLTEDEAGSNLMLEGVRLAGALLLGILSIPLALQIGRYSDGKTWVPLATVTLALTLVVALGVGARDVLQRWLERRLFRERFRLEKALQRIQRSVGQLADPQFLSERTLLACCEVLQAEWAAMYLRDGSAAAEFRLVGQQGPGGGVPVAWTPNAALLRGLEAEGGLVSTYGDHRTQNPDLLDPLVSLGGDLIHLLEIDGEAAGLLVLGPKAAGGVYTSEDGTFLTALTQLTGVALHCVRVHQDLTQLNEQLRMKVDRIAQQKQQILLLQAELSAMRPAATIPNEQEFRRDAIKGSGQAIEVVLKTARKAAASESTVLIRGESGTGKELLARAIHENSPRRHGPLITVHCAALAPSLLESELFGHVKGAFTGAMGDRRGRIELAQGGTLFLDEVGELSPDTQVKLLRVLQQREIEPVGGSDPIPVDVRLVAATHRDLEQMISDGRFREDLYYRLNVITITLPALRERRDDLHELAAEFLRRAAEKCDKRVVDFEEPALDALLSYGWPGNIRELENVIERAVVLSEGELISLDDLPADLIAMDRRGAGLPKRMTEPRRRSVLVASPSRVGQAVMKGLDPGAERQLLMDALKQADGNKARAARQLGLARSTFFSKLKKYGLFE